MFVTCLLYFCELKSLQRVLKTPNKPFRSSKGIQVAFIKPFELFEAFKLFKNPRPALKGLGDALKGLTKSFKTLYGDIEFMVQQ